MVFASVGSKSNRLGSKFRNRLGESGHAGKFAGEHLLGDWAAGGFEAEVDRDWLIFTVAVFGGSGRRREDGFDLGGLTPEGTTQGGGLDEAVSWWKG